MEDEPSARWDVAEANLGTQRARQRGGLAQPFFLIFTRVPCPCLSGFWRDGAGIFILNDD